MSAPIPRCARCGRPMPNWLEAISIEIAVCSKCFNQKNRLIGVPFAVKSHDPFDQPVPKAISDLINCREEKLANLALSALSWPSNKRMITDFSEIQPGLSDRRPERSFPANLPTIIFDSESGSF